MNKFKSSTLLKEAAESGDVEAQIYVGVSYVDGKGVERNLEKAKEYLTKAAKSGDKFAEKLISEIKKMG